MKVKIFVSIDDAGNPHEVENEINNWMAKNPDLEVFDIKQSESFDDLHNLTITIFYRQAE